MKTLNTIIRREIAAGGVLSFARFMELALYCPVYGYYETKKDNPGQHGDFFTSVSVGKLFGQLLAFQFAEWLQADVRCPMSDVRIVEAGAHDGQLARDILAWLQLKRPKLFEQIEYWIIEPSLRREKWQEETLKEFTPRIRWFTKLSVHILPKSEIERHYFLQRTFGRHAGPPLRMGRAKQKVV